MFLTTTPAFTFGTCPFMPTAAAMPERLTDTSTPMETSSSPLASMNDGRPFYEYTVTPR